MKTRTLAAGARKLLVPRLKITVQHRALQQEYSSPRYVPTDLAYALFSQDGLFVRDLCGILLANATHENLSVRARALWTLANTGDALVAALYVVVCARLRIITAPWESGTACG